MPYTKQTFTDGQTLYADDLNKMSEGVVAAGYTHAIPKTRGIANAIKRAKQLTDVKWTPVKNMPGVMLDDEGNWYDQDFVAGTEYTGIPYSGGVISTYTYVGLNVGLNSFVTAVQNPNSVLYTKTLNNTKGDTYFGTVCSKFAQYVLNMPGSYNTSNVPRADGMTTIAQKGGYTEYDVQLCDVLVKIGSHTAVITDIIYDTFGRIKFVEVSEAMPPCCRRLLYTPQEFYDLWVTDYNQYRYTHLYDIPYTQNEYVDVEDETGAITEFDCALMPEYGDKYNYTVSANGTAIVHVLKEDFYGKAVVKRDGVVVDEIEGLEPSMGADSFTFSLATPGEIEIYLEDEFGEKIGESVYAKVVDATITVVDGSGYDNGTIEVSYTGTSGKPIYVQFGTGQAEFCRLDGLGDTVVHDANSATLSFSTSYAGDKKVRVAYQNEYGTYYSPIVTFTTEATGNEENTSTDAYLSQGLYYNGYNLQKTDDTLVEKANYWTYTKIPVEANTTYLVEGATRVWFYDKDNTAISTINAYTEVTPQYQFTTPDKVAYMSVSYTTNEDLIQRGAETVVKIGAANAATDAMGDPEDMLVSETGATLVENSGLSAGSYTDAAKTDGTFTYKNIPVDAGATYYTRGGTRAWFLNSNKVALTTSGKTINIYTGVEIPYTFTVPSGAAYISIAYSSILGAKADMVYIRKLA